MSSLPGETFALVAAIMIFQSRAERGITTLTSALKGSLMKTPQFWPQSNKIAAAGQLGSA
jgi:hypothetical protein